MIDRKELPLVSLATLCAVLLLAPARATASGQDRPTGKVSERIAPAVQAFDLRQVRLLPGPFQHAMELDRQYLLTLEPDRLLHNFRVNAGLPSSAKPLSGWERPDCELRGHFTGHYLSACSLMYASTGDPVLKQRVETVVAGLAECQAKGTNGYLSAFPETFFDRLEAHGKVWAPYYTLHKILAGLRDVHRYCDNEQALAAERKLADWVTVRISRLSDRDMGLVLGTEHGGMNEVLADLYVVTGEEKYLKAAQRFTHAAVIRPAAQMQDDLNGLHANTQVPKFTGALRLYELTGSENLKTAAQFFWESVARERSYVTGGSSDREHFTPKQQLSEALTVRTAESCVAYNMLKLTRGLMCQEPRAEYGDYYERTLYNQILASQNPEDGMMCYFVPLKTGSRKVYSTPTGWCNCCTGTGIESHARYGESIYFYNDTSLYVNLFIASELNWKVKGFKLRQDTTFPEEGRIRLVFTCAQPVELNVNLRNPWWAPTNSIRITINGGQQAVSSAPGKWIQVKRTWKTGDTLDMTMPFTLRTEGFRDNPKRVAFMHGPVVLCAEVGTNSPVSIVTASKDLLVSGIRPLADKANTFRSLPGVLQVAAGSTNESVVLEPFYKMHGARPYAVYWDLKQPFDGASARSFARTAKVQ